MAEDEANDRYFIKRAFAQCGVEQGLRFVDDGEQAVAYLTGKKPYHDRTLHPSPALLIVDLKMPRRSGFEVIEWVRKSAEWRCLPVLVLSSSSLDQDVQRAYELTANNYISKPASFVTLTRLVQEVCEYWFKRSLLPRCGRED